MQDFTKPFSMNPGAVVQNTPESIAAENARFMAKVYLWMCIGLALSGIVAFGVASSEELSFFILGNKVVFFGLLIAEFAAVLTFSMLAHKVNALVATALYLLYSFLTGLTLSVIFFVYTFTSIIHVFAITSFAFAGLSAFGYITKRDLGPLGSFCSMGLFGLIGFGLTSLIFPGLMTSTASMVYGIIGIIVFSGLTAYDTQKIKQMNVIGNEGTAEDHKEAVYGALILYLDFINLFLKMLRVMGRRR